MISASAVGTPAVKTSAEAALPAPAEASSASISSKPGEKALTRNTGVAASFGDALRARIDAETEAGGGAPTLQMPATPVANLTGPPLNDVVGWQRMRGQSTSRAVKLDASTQPLDQTQGGAATATALVPAASGHSPSHTLGSTLAAATTAPVPTPQFPPAPSVTAAAISVAAATSQTDARKAEPVANTGVATARITTISRSAANSRPAPERATTGVARVADSRAAPQAAVQAATTGAARVADAPKTALQAPSTKAVVTPTISSGRANRAAAAGRALTAQAPQDAAADSNAVGAKPASPAPRAGDAGVNDAALHDLAANDASASDDSDVSAAPPAVSADVASGVAPLPALHVAAPERQSAALVQVDAPGQAAHALHASAVGPTQEAAAATPTPQARQTLVQALGEHLQVQIAHGSQNVEGNRRRLDRHGEAPTLLCSESSGAHAFHQGTRHGSAKLAKLGLALMGSPRRLEHHGNHSRNPSIRGANGYRPNLTAADVTGILVMRRQGGNHRRRVIDRMDQRQQATARQSLRRNDREAPLAAVAERHESLVSPMTLQDEP